MNLTPNDIRNYVFPGQLRGYDKDAVNKFREETANALEAARQENLKLSMEVESLKSQLTGLRQFEDTIKGAAIDARRNADMTVANAKQEAELILGRARAEAEKEVESRSRMIAAVQGQLSKLELVKRSYESKLKGLISSHLELIEEISGSEFSQESAEGLEVTESSEVRTRGHETVSTKPAQQRSLRIEEASAPGMIVEPDDAVDPELAQALQSYTGEIAMVQPDDTPPPRTVETRPPVSVFVETTARAEDIPPGFVAKPDQETADSTDRIAVSPDAAQPLKRQHMTPEELEGSIDDVAAGFEETMDIADKS